MIDWNKTLVWAAVGGSVSFALVKVIAEFFNQRTIRIKYQKEKVYAKHQIPKQNGRYLVKQWSQQLKQVKRQINNPIEWPIGTNDCLFDVYPIRQMVSQFRTKNVKIVNQNILRTSYQYESIYNRPKEQPGIFGTIMIGMCGTLALIPEICFKAFQPVHPGEYVDYNLISGPTIGFLKCTIKLLSDSWMVAQYQIDGNGQKILLLGLSREDILEYYRRNEWFCFNKILLLSLLSAFLYKPLKTEFKKLVNWYKSKNKQVTVTSKLLSVEVDQQMNCIICFSGCPKHCVYKMQAFYCMFLMYGQQIDQQH